MRGRLAFSVTAMLLVAVWSSAQTGPPPAERELTVFTSEQQSVTPGYPVGDIAIGNPKVADFKVMPGRREVLVFGKGIGSTRLILWDQKKVKRGEIVINVTTRLAVETLTTLRDLLRDFPSVEVRQMADSLVVTGTVSSKDDQAAIEKIAAAAKAKSLVRYIPPAEKTPVPPAVSSAPPTPVPPFRANPPATPLSGAGSSDAPTEIEYEIELLEASSRFRSGSYATGVEPSGRSLYKGVVRAPIGTERQLFIGGDAVMPSKNPSGASTPKIAIPTTQTGIKLTVRPTSDTRGGKFKTALLVETNLPFANETYDPTIWRRARWEFTAASGEPFGITGADLLATPDANDQKGSAIGSATQAASKATMVPGLGTMPGAEYVPVFGSLFGSKSYKQKATQLLVILRPRAIRPLQ